MPSPRFDGQVAIISGGLGDIGSAIARRFAVGGATVAIGDVRPAAAAQALLDEIATLSGKGVYHNVDVSDPVAVARWVDDVAAVHGVPTLVIANAAIVSIANVLDIAPARWSADLRTNLDGAFFLTQACAQRLRDAKLPGRIVFIGSWAAHAPHKHIPAYCASKAGLRMLCQTMALELAPLGIYVNEVAPGYVDAGLSKAAWEKNPDLYEAAKGQVPNNLLITADDVAAQVVNLCNPENRHMVGATIIMDGGLSLTNASTMQSR
jgi:NAD(P)-dependent dehydrogenase (short-subunit alcohol dehydrogenase family)